MNKIRVMIVDDSIFFREFMSRSLSKDPNIEVVAVASDAVEAEGKLVQHQPDVIALDVEMPKLRGTDFLKTIRPKYPKIQVVVISSVSSNVFEALKAGAVDFVAKPNAQVKVDSASFIREITSKIRIAAATGRIKVPEPQPRTKHTRKTAPPAAVIPAKLGGKTSRDIIAIGASTGGTEAILAVLKDLPSNTPGIVIVQHMPPLFTRMYAERLDSLCHIAVREAKNGDRVSAGLALIAPGDKHMRLKCDSNGYYVRCEDGEKVSGHRPSVDVLFESVAGCAGDKAIGVILTGMGADGAKQLLGMKKAGAHTISQDAASCVVYGMPMVAFNIGAAIEQLPLTSIPGAIVRQLSK